MASRFENFDLGRALAKALNIKGLKNAPTDLNTDQVQCVIDILQFSGKATPNGGQGTAMMNDSGLQPINGLANYFFPVVYSGSLNNPFACAAGLAYRMDSIHFYLQLDAAGAVAMNGKKVGIQLRYEETGGDPAFNWPIVTHWPAITIATGRIDYFWSMHGANNDGGPALAGCGWDGRVPDLPGPTTATSRIGLGVSVVMLDGTNFAANTKGKLYFSGRQGVNGLVPDP